MFNACLLSFPRRRTSAFPSTPAPHDGTHPPAEGRVSRLFLAERRSQRRIKGQRAPVDIGSLARIPIPPLDRAGAGRIVRRRVAISQLGATLRTHVDRRTADPHPKSKSGRKKEEQANPDRRGRRAIVCTIKSDDDDDEEGERSFVATTGPGWLPPRPPRARRGRDGTEAGHLGARSGEVGDGDGALVSKEFMARGVGGKAGVQLPLPCIRLQQQPRSRGRRAREETSAPVGAGAPCRPPRPSLPAPHPPLPQPPLSLETGEREREREGERPRAGGGVSSVARMR